MIGSIMSYAASKVCLNWGRKKKHCSAYTHRETIKLPYTAGVANSSLPWPERKQEFVAMAAEPSEKKKKKLSQLSLMASSQSLATLMLVTWPPLACELMMLTHSETSRTLWNKESMPHCGARFVSQGTCWQHDFAGSWRNRDSCFFTLGLRPDAF